MPNKYDKAYERLRTARIAAGFKTARAFCEKNAISISTYSLHEAGKRNLKPKVAKKYADLLGINDVWLLTGSGNAYENLVFENSMPITQEEFSKLLQYKGDRLFVNTQKTTPLDNINMILLTKIIVEISKVLNDFKIDFDLNQLSQKSSEMYADIVESASKLEDQLNMVNLSMTVFKKQLQEIRATQSSLMLKGQ